MLTTLGSFFDFDISRFANPLVIIGMVLIVIGVLVMIFRAKIAYKITKRLKGADDDKLSKVCLIVIGVALAIVVIGSIMAILALPAKI